MTAAEEISKELQERSLERQGAVNLWLRFWRPDLVIRLKDDHARLSDRFSRQIDHIPDLSKEPSEEDERKVTMLHKTWQVLRENREMMMAIALHPTRPKAQGPARRGGPGKGDPALEAHVVSDPPVRETPE